MYESVKASHRLPWLGLTSQGSLLLPLHCACVPPPHEDRVLVEDRPFQRKPEHDVTVMNRAWGSTALAALGQARLLQLFERRKWMIESWGGLILVHRPADETGKPDAWSIIQLIDMPAMQAFVDEVATKSGLPPRQAVPHVTRYVSGSPEGIGLPDGQALQARQVRILSARELLECGDSEGRP